MLARLVYGNPKGADAKRACLSRRDRSFFAAPARGAIAQLGERDNGIVEVRGSIPLGSTIFLIRLRCFRKDEAQQTEERQSYKVRASASDSVMT